MPEERKVIFYPAHGRDYSTVIAEEAKPVRIEKRPNEAQRRQELPEGRRLIFQVKLALINYL